MNDELVNWTVNCPDGEWGDGFTVNVERLADGMSYAEIRELGDVIHQFERLVGLQITSETTADWIYSSIEGEEEDSNWFEEKIFALAVGPASGAGSQLCATTARAIENCPSEIAVVENPRVRDHYWKDGKCYFALCSERCEVAESCADEPPEKSCSYQCPELSQYTWMGLDCGEYKDGETRVDPDQVRRGGSE